MNPRVTSKQVADAAGVSRSAVSLVLNGRADGYLAKETQARIREVAEALGYRPNLLAQSLVNQRSKVIGIMSDQAVAGPFDGAIIAGADAVARKSGYMTLAADTEGNPEQGDSVAALLLDRAVDGLIFLTVGLHETRVLDAFLRVPSALANCYPAAGSPAGSEQVPAFLPDEVAGGRSAAEHLISLGHRRIAMFRGQSDSPASAARQEGYLQAMAAAGLEVFDRWLLEGGFRIAPGYAAATAVLDVPAAQRPTAVVAGNDRAAIGVILAAARLGLSVPMDLSVVGYDDESGIADTMVPPLTTLALPLKEMGGRAMAAVISRLNAGAPAPAAAPAPPEQVLLPCQLIVRQSTSAPREG